MVREMKHGHALSTKRTTEYIIWGSMIKRCTNPKCQAYPNYGGRGIFVCERWLDFRNFYLDMGARPVGLTLERRNNNEGYNPTNCYWATRSQNSLNRRQWYRIGSKGYVFHPVGKKNRVKRYQAIFCQKGKRYSLGYFLTAEEAHAAYEVEKCAKSV